ncbi:hypothetical protein SAMN05421874_12897 [Nonomuraea maritima]|uniref:Uncharacterized protein n=1 Tax=Nonomuraea maritima TaxID=683260 RepID=A0A1G9MLZ6_9ACTN|nr:hypothetical protein [Nonomuraea maritima]SDL75288.1 hypothetical protein SAMN05421874_12897 [Nonomuraea maritima]
MRREIHSNYRLVITPDLRDVLPRGDHAATLLLLDRVAAATHRHVDHVRGVKVEFDKRAVCSFCGYDWETVTEADLAEHPEAYEGQVVGEPVCCEPAAAEFRAEQNGGL